MVSSQGSLPPYLFNKSRRQQNRASWLQTLWPDQYEVPLTYEPQFLSWKVGGNKVDNEACKFLSRVDWRNLHTLYLSTVRLKSFQSNHRKRLPPHLQGQMEKFGEIGPWYFLFDLDGNKICDKGCQNITKRDWPSMRIFEISIFLNISVVCGIREEGCRFMAKNNR